MDLWLAAVWASSALDLLLLVVALRPKLRRVSPAAAIALWLAKAIAAFALTRSGFGVLHLIYLDLVVVLPLAALYWLATNRRAAPTWPRLVALACLLLAPVGLYASQVEPYRLQLETAAAPLAADRQGKAPIRIGIMSDIQATHVTDYERGAIARLMALQPDLILIAGDFLQEYDGAAADRQVPAFRELLQPLSAPGGVFAARGDADAGNQLEQMVVGTNVRLLVNEVAHTQLQDRRITIGGVELDYRSPASRATIASLEGAEAADIRLLLSHRPDAAELLPPNTRVDLAVAGHTHGGQVAIPFFGPLLTLTDVPRHVAAGGLHDLGDNRRIYVTRGVGLERGRAPQLRFLVPPDISLVTLGG